MHCFHGLCEHCNKITAPHFQFQWCLKADYGHDSGHRKIKKGLDKYLPEKMQVGLTWPQGKEASETNSPAGHPRSILWFVQITFNCLRSRGQQKDHSGHGSAWDTLLWHQTKPWRQRPLWLWDSTAAPQQLCWGGTSAGILMNIKPRGMWQVL